MHQALSSESTTLEIAPKLTALILNRDKAQVQRMEILRQVAEIRNDIRKSSASKKYAFIGRRDALIAYQNAQRHYEIFSRSSIKRQRRELRKMDMSFGRANEGILMLSNAEVARLTHEGYSHSLKSQTMTAMRENLFSEVIYAKRLFEGADMKLNQIIINHANLVCSLKKADYECSEVHEKFKELQSKVRSRTLDFLANPILR